MSLEAVAKRESSFPDISHQSAPPATGFAGTVRKEGSEKKKHFDEN